MDLFHTTVTRNGNPFKSPFFLDHKDILSVEKAIAHFEENLGKKKDSINRHKIMDLFPKRIIGRGVLTVLSKWYYSLEGLAPEDDVSSSEWRIRFYQYLQDSNIGWLPPDKIETHRHQLMTLWEHEAGNAEFDKLLFGDHKVNFHIRQRQVNFGAEDVIKRYNTDVIYYIFSRSYRMWIDITALDISGELVKTVIRNSKFWGIYTEIERKGGKVRIEAIGPNELVGRKIKYGRLLYALFYSIVELLPENTDLFIETEFHGRNSTFLLPIDSIPNLLPTEKAFNQDLHSPYDSNIEKEFAKKFITELPHWTLENEAVLIEGGTIFIPDFVLKYRDIILYLEIVGFWTSDYLRKKITKLKKFARFYDNLIVLVDERLDFPKMSIPIFTYGSKMQLFELKEYLAKNYSNKAFLAHVDYLFKNRSKILTKITEFLKRRQVLVISDLQEIFQTYSKSETKQAAKMLFQDSDRTDGYIFLGGYDRIISTEYFDQLKSKLKKTVPSEGIQENELELKLDIETALLSVILRVLGYKQEYRSLMDVVVYPPS